MADDFYGFTLSEELDEDSNVVDTEFYSFVHEKNGVIRASYYGNVTKRNFANIEFSEDEFIAKIPELFVNRKLVAILMEHNGLNMEVFRSIERHLNEINSSIRAYLIGIQETFVQRNLVAADLVPRYGQTFLVINIRSDVSKCSLSEVQYTEDGFKRVDFRLIDPKNRSISRAVHRQQILGSNSVSEIIMRADEPGNQLTRILRDELLAEDEDKHVIIERPLDRFETSFVVNTCMWILDRSCTQFHVIPRTFENFFLGYKFVGEYFHLIDTEDDQYLPFSGSKTIPKSHFKCFVGYVPHSSRGAKISETFELPEKAHQHQITLNIDISNMCSFEVTPIINDKIAALPETLNKKSTSTAPVIGLFEDISVICIANDDGSYEFMEKWNGMYGKDLFISFDQEEPQFFDDAVETYKAKESHVVHDLLKLIAMPVGAVSSASFKPYKIQQNYRGETLIEYKSCDGKSKTATPDFLMSLILKEHIKAIEPDSGEKPKEIGFCVFGDFDAEGKKQIEKCLEDFCKLLAINCFVIHENV